MSKKSIISDIMWIRSISSRFARVDRKSKSAVTSKLATVGICFGVMTLIVVMSIMNGFQLSFIDAILELSSYHIQVSELDENFESDFINYCSENNDILCVSPFYEAQTLMTSEFEKECSAVIRAIDPDCINFDNGFKKQLVMRSGYFDLEDDNSIILGSKLAKNLGVRVGDTINLFVLSGSSDVELFSNERIFTVTGVFSSGYSQLNESYSYIKLSDGIKYFGNKSKRNYGIKIKNSESEQKLMNQISKKFIGINCKSWRDYNKSFFGALKIEKNMLLFLVAIIFLVVGINIYNGMRRLVFERKNEIAILSAFGAGKLQIQSIFTIRGFTIGFFGSLFGVILGLLISINTSFFFQAVSSVMFWFQYLITAITSPDSLNYIHENSVYVLYASIPARILVKEVIFISLFGLMSPLLASWLASKNVLKLTVSEVLRDE